MTAVCDICGALYDATDDQVTYLPIDGVWRCTYEDDCTSRRARNEAAGLDTREVAAMYRALDQVWDRLARDGWYWPAP